MGRKPFHLIFFFLLLFVSCENELKTDVFVEEKPCLNCVLNPDSTIKATLSLSHSMSENNAFKKIKNAFIEISQNGQLMGELQNTGDGIYTLDAKPTEGYLYKINVKTNEYKSLHAETIVPVKPNVTYKFTDTFEHLQG